jgi:PhoH-like ATPase
MNKKTYILDTNVLLHDPRAFSYFKGGIIYLHLVTISELESFKSESSERGYNAREAIRFIDGLREKNSLTEGVAIDEETTLVVSLYKPEDESVLKNNDDTIIYLAKKLAEEVSNAILVSKDFAMRIKASLLGVPIQDYQSEHVSKDNFYQGWKEFYYPSGDIKNSTEKILKEIQQNYTFTINEFALLSSTHRDGYSRIFRYLGPDHFLEIIDSNHLWGISGKNSQQKMIINLLLDDSVKLVTIFGPSGTGKTFLVLATMLYKVLCEKIYQKLIVSRPIVPLGNDIGYLPGDLYEKLQSWMQPIKDNLDFLLHLINNFSKDTYELCPTEEKKKKYFHKKGRFDSNARNERNQFCSERRLSIDDLVGNENKVSLEAITYMRGRSIPFQIIFIDEVQNLTPHEVKTLISRAGEGTKVILVGDPYQIDSPYLDFVSNGLVVASEKFRGQSIFGSVYLAISERSELSALVNELM